MTKEFSIFYRVLGASLLVCLLQACGKAEDPAKEEGSASSISGYNYTNEGIQEFYVNGQWGGGIGVGEGGGSNVCCVNLPKKWTPGLTATVTWVRTDCGEDEKRCPRGTGGHGWHHKTLEATVPIESYDRPYTMYVAFLPNDEVKIYVTPVGLRNPSHPANLGKPRPLDHPEWKR